VTATTDIWHPGPLLPSPDSEHHLLAADISCTTFVAVICGPNDNGAIITGITRTGAGGPRVLNRPRLDNLSKML
jgi:hypothetical protein